MTRYSRYIPTDDAERTSDYTRSNDRFGGMDSYFAHDDDGKAIAMANIANYRPTDSTAMRTYDRDTATETSIADGQRAHAPEDDGYGSWDEGMTRPAKSGEQMVMFGHKHTPARSGMHELYARDTLGGKTAAMTLLGMADMASTVTTGRPLQPSSSLSAHSMSLVNKLHQSGAISDEDMPDPSTMDNDNGITFHYANRQLDQHPYNNQLKSQDLTSRIPHARARIREAMGRGPKAQARPEQLKFEGFE